MQIVFLFFFGSTFCRNLLIITDRRYCWGIAYCVFSGFYRSVGAWLLRQQGFATWQRFQTSLAQGAIPAYEMIEGPILLVGGALLLTPGFFTDAVGFACLIPATRRKLAKYVIENQLVNAQPGSPFQKRQARDENIIEGEFKKGDD